LYNEIPDRVSDAAICIGAGYGSGSLPELGYVAAVVALFVAYVRAQGAVAGAPQEFCGPMAKPQRMFTLRARSTISYRFAIMTHLAGSDSSIRREMNHGECEPQTIDHQIRSWPFGIASHRSRRELPTPPRCAWSRSS